MNNNSIFILPLQGANLFVHFYPRRCPFRTLPLGWDILGFQPEKNYDFFLSPINHAAINPVNVPNNATPVIIRNAAIILPSDVIGYLSPYPTVVMVTNAHHIASPAVFILHSGNFSTWSIDIEPKINIKKDTNETVENVPDILVLKIYDVKNFTDLKALKTLNNLTKRINLP